MWGAVWYIYGIGRRAPCARVSIRCGGVVGRELDAFTTRLQNLHIDIVYPYISNNILLKLPLINREPFIPSLTNHFFTILPINQLYTYILNIYPIYFQSQVKHTNNPPQNQIKFRNRQTSQKPTDFKSFLLYPFSTVDKIYTNILIRSSIFPMYRVHVSIFSLPPMFIIRSLIPFILRFP
jgi:hypothetical protein